MLRRKLIFKYDDGILMYLRNLPYYFLIIIFLLYNLTIKNILIYYNIITLKKKLKGHELLDRNCIENTIYYTTSIFYFTFKVITYNDFYIGN